MQVTDALIHWKHTANSCQQPKQQQSAALAEVLLAVGKTTRPLIWAGLADHPWVIQ